MTSIKLATWSLCLALFLPGTASADDTGTASDGHAQASPAAQAGSPLSAAQLSEMNSRIALANTIAQNVAADAQAKGLDDSWRVNLISTLLNTRSATLRTLAATANTLDQALAYALPAATATSTSYAASAAADPKSLGSTGDSLVYTPMTPCRFADTRVTGAPLTSSPKIYITQLDGTLYGGSSGCSLGAGFNGVAFAANITVVDPEGGPGFLSVRPAGSTQLTSFLNWTQTGPAVALANAGIITAQIASIGGTKFEMYVAGSAPNVTAHAIVDYFGYFAVAKSNPVTPLCEDSNVNSHPIAAGQVDSVTATCPQIGAQYTLTSGGCDTSSSKAFMRSSKVADGDPNSWTCSYANTGSAALIAAYVKCCVIPAH